MKMGSKRDFVRAAPRIKPPRWNAFLVLLYLAIINAVSFGAAMGVVPGGAFLYNAWVGVAFVFLLERTHVAVFQPPSTILLYRSQGRRSIAVTVEDFSSLGMPSGFKTVTVAHFKKSLWGRTLIRTPEIWHFLSSEDVTYVPPPRYGKRRFGASQLHSRNGKPARRIITDTEQSTLCWMKCGLVHRSNGPASIETGQNTIAWVHRGVPVVALKSQVPPKPNEVD